MPLAVPVIASLAGIRYSGFGAVFRKGGAPMDFLLNVLAGVLVVLAARWLNRRR
jgi:hypothetical protein